MENIELLQKMGLTEYEARAYISLARLGVSTVKEIVHDSKLPRNKTYEALQKLELRNLIISMPRSPKKFKITNTEIIKKEVESMNKTVENLIKLIEEPKTNEFKELFWIIKSKKAITKKMSIQNSKSKKEIIGCNRFSEIHYENMREMKNAVDRGVKMKFISTFDIDKIENYKKYLKTGIEIRVWNEKEFGPLLQRMTVFDDDCARITIGRPEITNHDDYITIFSDSKAFTLMMKNTLKNMWKKCKPIEDYFPKKTS